MAKQTIKPPDFGKLVSEALGAQQSGAQRRERTPLQSRQESIRVSRQTLPEQTMLDYEAGLFQAYVGEWGVLPAPGYIQRAIAAGMNIWELIAHERAKPAWRNSPRYFEEKQALALGLAQRFGGVR